MNDNELMWESFLANQSQSKDRIGNNSYSRNIIFPNGLEASVVSKKGMSNGGNEGLFEIALFDATKGYDVNIETGEPAGTLGNSVAGSLDFEQVAEVLQRIKSFRNKNRSIDIESEESPKEIRRLR